jgi:hypothetical protein
MPRLTGIVVQDDQPVDGAYVQIRNTDGDFQGEVRTDDRGRFILYPIPGRWRVLCWRPGLGRSDQGIVVGSEEMQLQIALG